MKQKRIQVPVSPETEKAIRGYAETMGMSTAAACAQMLEQSAPGLVELTAAMQKAKESPARALREIALAVQKATQDADQLMLDMSPKATRKRKTG